MRRRLILVTVSLGCMALPAVATAALPKVLTQGTRHPFAVRPASIGYTGDGTGVLGGADGSGPRHPGHLHWTTYTRRHGIARGVAWLDDCNPDCAGGRFTPVPVVVHAFSPKHGRFTRLTLQYTDHGEHVTDRRRIRHVGSVGFAYWTYDIVSSR